MKFNSFVCGCLTTLAVVAGSALIFHKCERPTAPIVEESTVVVTDTLTNFVYSPIPKDSTVFRYETIKIPVPDTIRIYETVPVDSVSVKIPITQKTYQDSTYQAWVSGYHPALDSIRIFQPVTIITKTITNTEIRYKTKRWGVGIQAGIGVTPTKVEPYIGVGVTYNIFSW